MSDWPDGWTDKDGRDRYGRNPQPEPTRVMPTTRPTVPQQQPRGFDDYGDDGYNQGQVYGGGNGPRDPYASGSTRPAPNWRKRITVTALTLVVTLLVVSIATYFWADSKLKKEVDLSKVIDRPEGGEGTNYLIVGSDSREGMTDEQKKDLHTGSAEGKRTDSMMILHTGSNGPTLVSLPRDSWVTIPNFVGSESGKEFQEKGGSKLNAAYSIDGATLLTRTVEYNTGLHIDHYVEIGFAGFANIVDAVGGVEMDIPKAFKDRDAGAEFEAGKQTLNGEEALAFVRTRKAFGSDLERTKNQQKFLAALANQTATPSTILNPFKLYPTMGAGLDTLIVDKDMSPYKLAKMFWAMKGVTSGEGTSLNMPTSGSAPQGSLQWDMPKVKQLVKELKADDKVTVKS